MNEFLSKEHPYKLWAAYFDALKSTKLGHKSSLPGTNGSWENVDIPTLESISRASETFKTPKKLKLEPMLSPVNVPFTKSQIEPRQLILQTGKSNMGLKL
jgi:hypothetical protein